MDNATHALIGLLLAEAAIQFLPGAEAPRARFFRGAARLSSAFANNVNDLDFLYARRFGEKLGYLLHHRGHTHTLLFGLLGGALIAGFVLLLARLRARPLTNGERWTLLALGVIGPCVHIGFDFLNNYGVHPLWPFDRRWFYGDTLFIVEPWLLTLLIPPLFFQLESRLARGALGIVFVSTLVLAWGIELVPGWLAALLTLAGAGAVRWNLSARSRQRFAFGAVSACAVVALFALTSRLARARVEAALAPDRAPAPDARERLLDVVLTPAPGNPLCFSVVSLHVAGDRYVARAATLTLLPSLVTPEGCRVQPTGVTLGLSPSTRPSSAALAFQGQWVGSLAELARLNRSHCEFAALLHFARVPFWRAAGTELLVGDLRFDRDAALDFDELLLAEPPRSCPSWVPDWQPPRAALLGAAP